MILEKSRNRSQKTLVLYFMFRGSFCSAFVEKNGGAPKLFAGPHSTLYNKNPLDFADDKSELE